ncbi:hypothetical protein SUGI_1198710 [Cryptomeria japonica]|uniref:aluminum-activated malate transporter 10 isoform X2 n=1 Tax=Cryptomeria japonica TaxID=3369 RepID=UPI0024149FC0|nr:aluminum-activated malate transporter 10 isoform X2 [Cryptomeria japonica]GLJ55829.1 hypothetical protein SUGI_1198710 [Cryptomeria japonica]
MAESKAQASSLEWKINLPEGSVNLKPAQRGFHHRVSDKFCEIINGWKSGLVSIFDKIYKLGADDPRRIVHAMKVGMGLALVSLFYFMNPLFVSVGGTALWAVMTVVVVFEFTAGGTLSRGLNRICATLLGGTLAVGVNFAADCAGHKAEPIILGAAVFLQGAVVTFARFHPRIKARYDYGLLIFILTFSFMTVSGYRVDKLFVQAYERLATIVMGCILCIVISLVICPIWAGEDLHKLIIRNMEGLARSCEGCVAEYFREEGEGDKDIVTRGYKCVLNCKSSEESLANFARWEPAHGPFGFRYPWVQYLKIGAAMRYCAYCVEALNGCLNSETMAPSPVRSHLRAPCMKIAGECSKVLTQLAESIKTMTKSTDVDLMMDQLNKAVDELQSCLVYHPELFIDSKRWQVIDDEPVHNDELGNNTDSESKKLFHSLIYKQMGKTEKPIKQSAQKESKETSINFMDGLALATVACLLREIVARLSTVIEAVEGLGEMANFKSVENKQSTRVPIPPLSSPAAAKQVPPPPPLTKVLADLDTAPHSNVTPNNG